MSSSNSTSIPAVLVDTCVISGLARADMRPEDAQAFCRMADLVQSSRLTIWASTVAREEIDRIPIQHRAPHLREYNALAKIRASNATWLNNDPSSTGYGSVVQHPDYQAIRSVLKDENDARLVFQGKAGGLCDFVTVDYASILNKAPELAKMGIRALSPSEFMSSWST